MKVAVLGGGYAGVTLARRLESSLPNDVELLVIDESGEHLVQHELHRVIRRPSFADDIRVSLSDVLDDAIIRRARVTDVDWEANTVTLDNGDVVSYDYAGVCLGAETDFHDLPGVEEHATPLKRLEDARRIRSEFLELLAVGGRVVVGGAGLSGIQVAGELAALAAEQGAREAVEIVLIEQLDGVAPSFPPNFRNAVREELEVRGIDIRTGTTVRGADAETIEFDDGELRYDQLVWTGGIRGSAALDGDRPRVRGTLQLGDGTFIVGDAARVIDRNGEAVPASAQAAVGEARTAARNIRRLVERDYDGDGIFGPRLETFDFDPTGWIVSVGDGTVAQVGPTILKGAPALALKATVGVGHLTSVGAVRQAVELVVEEFGGEYEYDTDDHPDSNDDERDD